MPGDMRRPLYPPLEPYRTGRLRVSDLHEIHFEECGNPEGLPALVLHGGPAGGIMPYLRQGHDPARYRIILFDQRGCGLSTPTACLTDNTTWHLVADIEALRMHLGIERWQVAGGSWGSTLALAYAVTHPERVTALVLRGIFLLLERELRWFYQDGAGHVLPEAFADYLAPIPPAERGDMIAAYHRRLTGDDAALRRDCARAWSVWEGSALALLPDPARIASFAEDAFAAAFAALECHYFMHRGFFPQDGWLLTQAHRLRGIPGVIIHGRYDMITPMSSAHALAQACPDVKIVVVPDAGHTGTEPGIADAMVRATDALAHRFAALPARQGSKEPGSG
jgi:proline iminopeptidase